MLNIFKTTYRNLPDEALMHGIALRNERAFAELYDRYSARMHRYFYRMLWRDDARAADFTQELFLIMKLKDKILMDINQEHLTRLIFKTRRRDRLEICFSPLSRLRLLLTLIIF